MEDNDPILYGYRWFGINNSVLPGIVEIYADVAYDEEELLVITTLNKTAVACSSIMQQRIC